MSDCFGPVGVMDSGLGGISVLRELRKVMPEEDFIYYGDSLNAPYGSRPTEEVWELTVHVVDILFEKGCKAIVIACNTATSAAVRRLRLQYPETPIVGIEPALKPASLAHPGGNVVVMATPLTLREKKFRDQVAKYESMAHIHPLPCPELVEFVEQNITEGPELEAYLKKVLDPYRGKMDGVVLGCTHFPLVRDAIAGVVGPEVQIYDGGLGTAKEARRRIILQNLQREEGRQGWVTMINSSNDEVMIARSWDLLGESR